MSIFVEKILSPYMSGYNKGFSIQKALLSLIETQKKLLDKKGYGSVRVLAGFSIQKALLSLIETQKKLLDKKGYGSVRVLADLSKAFDTINYDLLLAKLHEYGFTNESLRLIKIYLKIVR